MARWRSRPVSIGVRKIGLRPDVYRPVGAHGEGRPQRGCRGLLADRDRNDLGAGAAFPDQEGLLQRVFVVGIHDELDGFVKFRPAQRPDIGRGVGDMLQAYIDLQRYFFPK